MNLDKFKLIDTNGLETPKKRKVGVYLLPNLITAGSLFFGLLSLKYSMEGRYTQNLELFVYAAYAILAASICDGLDGSVARLTSTQSSFGVQLDSLCDLVSFGVAPAFLIYNFALHHWPRLGFCLCFIYAACGTLRLARFNVQSSLGKANGNFTGIPIPMAAAPMAIYIVAQSELHSWLTQKDKYHWEILFAQTLTSPMAQQITCGLMVFLLALGMISTFEYYSHKSMRLPTKRPFRVFAFILILCALFFTLQFVISVTLLLMIYCLHGPILWLFTRKDKSDEEEELFESEEEL